MRDRFLRGYAAGLIASVFATAFGMLAYSLRLSARRYATYQALLIFGHQDRVLAEKILAQFWQTWFMGAAGTGFAYLLKWTGERGAYWKGLIYGGSVWYVIHVGGLALDVGPQWYVPWLTSLMHFIAALIWGLVLTFALRWLEPKGRA